MLTIRFFRVGKINQPVFKIVVTEKSHASRSGRFVEDVGFYNPSTKEKKLIAERIKYWLGVGAQASDTVYNLLVAEKIVEGNKRKINIAKSKKEKSAEAPVQPQPKIAEEPVKEAGEEARPEEKPVEEPQEKETKPEEPELEEPKEEVKIEKKAL
jgi:small subunit ribosomal protein S16